MAYHIICRNNLFIFIYRVYRNIYCIYPFYLHICLQGVWCIILIAEITFLSLFTGCIAIFTVTSYLSIYIYKVYQNIFIIYRNNLLSLFTGCIRIFTAISFSLHIFTGCIMIFIDTYILLLFNFGRISWSRVQYNLYPIIFVNCMTSRSSIQIM